MFTIVNTTFINWLNEVLADKGWSQADLSKRAEVSTSMISSVLSGRREPGINFLSSVASALRVAPEDLYRLAGLLPSEKQDDETLHKISSLYGTLREDKKHSPGVAGCVLDKVEGDNLITLQILFDYTPIYQFTK